MLVQTDHVIADSLTVISGGKKMTGESRFNITNSKVSLFVMISRPNYITDHYEMFHSTEKEIGTFHPDKKIITN